MKVTHGHEPGTPSETRGSTFTGTVHADPVITGIGVTVNTVFFPPAARTHWHSHDDGQLLLITHGAGYVATRTGDARSVGPGDAVWFEPGEEHWHGAGPDTYLTHTAISLGGHDWLEAVSDGDYASAIDAAGA